MKIYQFGKFICTILLVPLFRIKVIGKENIPKEGPVIICSNHISNFDPPVVGLTNKRPVSFMAKAELFDKTLTGWLMRKIRAFPVRRGLSDRRALRNGLKLLENDQVLGLFPEGTRSKDLKLGKGLAGAGFFALRSQAKVVPCAIIGPYRPFRRLHVVYGEPVDFEELRNNKASAQEAADLIMEEIRIIQEDFKSII